MMKENERLNTDKVRYVCWQTVETKRICTRKLHILRRQHHEHNETSSCSAFERAKKGGATTKARQTQKHHEDVPQDEKMAYLYQRRILQMLPG